MGSVYFAAVCFLWAAAALLSRFLMLRLGQRWNAWEMGRAYPAGRPKWLFPVYGLAIAMVLSTWRMAFHVPKGWILATLLTLTLVKTSAAVFRYHKFRAFAGDVLGDKRKLRKLNAAVFALAGALVILGVYYMSNIPTS